MTRIPACVRQVYTAPLSDHAQAPTTSWRLDAAGRRHAHDLRARDVWRNAVAAQIKAQARSAASPAWSKGILPISQESYYNAIECGKQGGEDPPCVFYDTGLCQNADFTLALYTPYKMVAYEVWRVVRQKQPAAHAQLSIGAGDPHHRRRHAGSGLEKPDYQSRPQARGTGGDAGRSIRRRDGGGRFTFDYPAFAANADVTLDLVGRVKSVSCLIDTIGADAVSLMLTSQR